MFADRSPLIKNERSRSACESGGCRSPIRLSDRSVRMGGIRLKYNDRPLEQNDFSGFLDILSFIIYILYKFIRFHIFREEIE